VEENFRVLCRLHDEGRDNIWSYYVHNLARPVWLSRPENRVDVLIGNPPWLSYRHMPTEMQVRFRQMSQDRHLWHGRDVATHQDLSGLFIARSAQQYLTAGGIFAFVVPNAVLDRDYFAGFRAGHYPDSVEPIAVKFTGSWDLRWLRPHFFPRGSAVVFGRRSTATATSLPTATELWSGRLPRGSDTWAAVEGHVTRVVGLATEAAAEGSAYVVPNSATARRPTLACCSWFVKAGPLGLASGRRAVRSARSSTEKDPWKLLPDRQGVIEAEFVRPVLLGESVLPYQVLRAREAVLPLESEALLDGDHSHLDRYPGLADWWRDAEQQWLTHRSSARLTLRERLDFRGALRTSCQHRPSVSSTERRACTSPLHS